jgi:hypothetical protein
MKSLKSISIRTISIVFKLYVTRRLLTILLDFRESLASLPVDLFIYIANTGLTNNKCWYWMTHSTTSIKPMLGVWPNGSTGCDIRDFPKSNNINDKGLLAWCT